MSFSKIYTRSICALSAPLIEVEVHISQGLPSLTIVGLPETAVRESKDRVRSAIINSGFTFPSQRLTINLAPADLPKEGTRLDLPIAMGILMASGQISSEQVQDYEFVGELALDGRLRPIRSMLTIAMACQKDQRALILPLENQEHIQQLTSLTWFPATTLKTVCEHFSNTKKLIEGQSIPLQSHTVRTSDLSEIKGQAAAKRALEIAAAGGHSLLFRGPPGTGKTLLSSCLAGILPPLNSHDMLDIANIYSIADQAYMLGTRPFRAPHHTCSAVALVGGGTQPKPGEITLAHHGVLFLDELPEFDRKVLEVLRQPMESKEITISRASRKVTFPAHFQLIAAMNPCPCGYHFNQDTRCQCSIDQIKRYQNRISGPLLDRIDLHIDVPPISYKDMQEQKPEDSTTVQQRVYQAYKQQVERQGIQNQLLNNNDLEKYCPLDQHCQRILELAQQKLNLSMRGYHRVLRVARTIADLDLKKTIQTKHLSEALSYRAPFE
ncbi:YifB family Mg chelatase-like AAA ATPase [Acinetobacter sp. B10A]|uniref:YifB family Mg chelatase-like AAA ATPase n=1 Tax=Acinetobacter baretiae TaxID=2605383 RepID=UPI001B3CA1E3|nr:YifB family Mg chelatase-like AAA ATPase [Acinetobacter baretiae]MBF7685374.1 YifB family Mg chelatase-like AAA ATPase [Acinetobacter baretiae]